MPRLLSSFGVGLLTFLLAYGVWAEERVVHFYQVNALTGQAGSYGTRSIHGVELGAKHINEAGGFTDICGNKYTIKLGVWDMANSREQAIAGLRKAADDRTVLAVLGSTPSTGFAAMEPVAAVPLPRLRRVLFGNTRGKFHIPENSSLNLCSSPLTRIIHES